MFRYKCAIFRENKLPVWEINCHCKAVIFKVLRSVAALLLTLSITVKTVQTVKIEEPHAYLLTYLLTPWCRVLLEKLTWFAASQEIPRTLWNPKVHYRTHKPPPPVSILGQPNPVHTPTSHFLDIHPNIIRPSMPRFPQWSLSLRFPHHNPIRPLLLTHTCHMPSPSHSSRFYHPHTSYLTALKWQPVLKTGIFSLPEDGRLEPKSFGDVSLIFVLTL